MKKRRRLVELKAELKAELLRLDARVADLELVVCPAFWFDDEALAGCGSPHVARTSSDRRADEALAAFRTAGGGPHAAR